MLHLIIINYDQKSAKRQCYDRPRQVLRGREDHTYQLPPHMDTYTSHLRYFIPEQTSVFFLQQ